MLLILIQLNRFRDIPQLTIHPYPDKTISADVLKKLLVFPFTAPHHRCQDLQALPLRQGHKLIDYLLHGLGGNWSAALMAVGMPHPGIQEPQVVINLGDGPHCRPGILTGGFLVNGNSRRQPPDKIHIGLIHLTQKLAGIGRQGFYIPPLPFGIDGIKG